MSLIKRFKQKETISLKNAREFFDSFNIEINKLDLPCLGEKYYDCRFQDLNAMPYMDVNEMKVKVTGIYLVSPSDWHSIQSANTVKAVNYRKGKSAPVTKVKIDTFGRVSKK